MKREIPRWSRQVKIEWWSAICEVLVEIVQVREGIRIFIRVLLVVRDIEKQHGGDGTIEALKLAVCLFVVRRAEGIRDAQDTASILVQLTY